MSNIVNRITPRHEEVGPASTFDGAEFSAHIHRSSAVERPDLQGGGWRNSCQNHGMQFAMRSKAGPELSPAGMIGAKSDEIATARVVERFHFFQLRFEDASELLVVGTRQV